MITAIITFVLATLPRLGRRRVQHSMKTPLGNLEDLYRRYGPSVLRRARNLLGNDADAQDAMQEVFMKVMRSSNEFRGAASPMTWLYRVTTNLCLNRLRDGRRRTELRQQHIAPRLIAAEQVGSMSGKATEAKASLSQILAMVPEDLGTVAIHHYMDGMSQTEVAEHLSISRRTVGYRLTEFRRAAKAAIADPKRPVRQVGAA